jgi:hypothetical protein
MLVYLLCRYLEEERLNTAAPAGAHTPTNLPLEVSHGTKCSGRNVAEAIGAKGIRLEDPADVKDSLAEALAYRGGPVVVDAVVDPFALSMPSHVPFHAAKGFTLRVAKQVLSGRMDTLIKTAERNVHLV